MEVWLIVLALPLGGQACTLIAATVGASTDGSGLVGSTNDCQDCDSRIARVEARTWPEGSLRPVYYSDDTYPREVGTGRNMIYEPIAGQNISEPIGHIPQVPQTYAYWEAVYGFMNEHGLGIAESSCPSKFVNLREMGGLLSIRELTRLTMERCKTARCGVQTAGSLAETYGFYGEDPDMSGAGDSLAFTDGKETWIFHVSGDPTGRSAFFVGQRIPDGHVAIIANTFIIRQVNCSNTAEFYCSTNLEQKLKATGEWDGHGALDWAAVVPPDLRKQSYVVNGFDSGPIPYYVTSRTWRVFSKLAPSLRLQLTDNILEYPFSIRPDSPISHRDFMDLWRDNFEGTEIDLTVGGLAGPFGSPYRQDAGVGLVLTHGQFARSMSLPRTNGFFVSHTFGEEGINKLWVGQDAPSSTVLVPFYSATMACAESYSIGNMSVYDDKSAWWVFDFVANWMGLNYRLMSADVTAKIHELQDEVDLKNAEIEERARLMLATHDVHGSAELLARHQIGLQQHVVNTWRQFSHFLIMKYNDGYLNDVSLGTPIGFPAWWLQMFHVDPKPTPKWCQPSSSPPSSYTELGPGPFENVPRHFQMYPASTLAATPVVAEGPTWSCFIFFAISFLLLGYVMGRRSSGTHAAVMDDSYCSMDKTVL